MLKEKWLPIPGYESHYIVSNHGRAATLMKNGEYKGIKLNKCTPYLSFGVGKKGSKRKVLYMHMLVCKVFIGERPTGMVIRHLDGNRYNNHIKNLQYGFPEENWKDAVIHKCHQGEKNGRSKLSSKDVIIIKNLLNENVSLSTIARSFNVSITCINLIDKGKNWKDI